jgi:hypothetical protein
MIDLARNGYTNSVLKDIIMVLGLCEVVHLPEEGVRLDITRSGGVQVRCPGFLKWHGGLGMGFMGVGMEDQRGQRHTHLTRIMY